MVRYQIAVFAAALMLTCICGCSSSNIKSDMPSGIELIVATDDLKIPNPTAQPDNVVSLIEPYITSETVEIVVAELDWQDGPNILGQLQYPIFNGFGDADFEKRLNDHFREEFSTDVKIFEEYYNSDLEDYKRTSQGSDEDLTDMYKRMLESMSYESHLNTVSTGEGYFSFSNTIYTYMGGAHGSTVINTYNIDLVEKKVLALADLFNTPDHKGLILEKLTEIKEENPVYENLMFPNQTIDTLSDTGFFLSDRTLIIFYQPYEIGPYAAGFISFDIAYEDLKDILADRFKDIGITVVAPATELLMNEAAFND